MNLKNGIIGKLKIFIKFNLNQEKLNIRIFLLKIKVGFLFKIRENYFPSDQWKKIEKTHKIKF